LRIAGANQGIGLETAKAIAGATSGRPHHVIIGSRDLSSGEAAASAINAAGGPGSASAVQLDVTEDASIRAAAAHVKETFGRLDALVNNAGILTLAEREGGSLVAALRKGWEVNLLGAAAATEAFLPLMLQPAPAGLGEARLVFVGSSMGSLVGASDPSSWYYKSVMGPSPTEYRVTKAGLNMLMIEYHKMLGTDDLRGGVPDGNRKIKVWTADPGPNVTRFSGRGDEFIRKARESGLPGPEVGAKVVAGCVLGASDGLEGKMVGAYGVSPW